MTIQVAQEESLWLSNPDFSWLKNKGIPRYIVVEGIDGSGKTTLIETLRKYLVSKGKRVLQVYEPGTTVLGENVRTIIKSGKVHPRVAHLLLEAARMDCLLMIHKKLAEHPELVVVGDRHVDSSYAYQGLMGVNSDFIDVVQEAYIDLPRPALTIYLDLTAEDAQKRRVNDGRRGKGDEDNFDGLDLKFFNAVIQRYYHRINLNRNQYFVVDASMSVDRVSNVVTSFLETF